MDASQFLSALLAIVVIDLVLAGDNAIVIALAARSLPAHLQKRAIIWGTVGAVAVRSALTVIVVWLLKIPGLLLVGGALLVWIAWKLLQPEAEGHDEQHPAATTFWGAMRTIVIADAIMGMDNVLGVAGAAHGNYVLVVLGLLISIPIVVWGSTLVLKVVEKYPVVIYLGSGVLIWTAAKMMSSEPIAKPLFAHWPALVWAMYALVPLVLWLAFVRNHRHLDSRIQARLKAFADQRPAAADLSTDPVSPAPGASTMTAALNVLVPIDGSLNSLQAVRHAINEYRRNHDLRLVLLNVQAPLSRHAARFLARTDREQWHAERAEAALASAKELLTKAEVPFQAQWTLGDRAEEICAAAKRLACHHIVMGTARKNSLTRMLQDSTTNRVLECTPVPVEVVSGEQVSKLERWGLPAGVGAGLGSLIYMAID